MIYKIRLFSVSRQFPNRMPFDAALGCGWPALRQTRLFRNHAASNPVARVASWVRLHVIGFGVNHQGRSAVDDQGAVAIAQVYTRIWECIICIPVSLDSEVRHVTGMRPLWILQTVVLLVRIEMWTSRRESWSLTLRDLVNVCGMLAGRQVLEVEGNRNAGTALAVANGGGANALSLRISQFHPDRFFRGAHGGHADESDNGTSNTIFGHVFSFKAILSRTSPCELCILRHYHSQF
jgi:hypothetical protein